jgi:endonuclease/exonuclease/phosphatase family metal-dependent hydrolase
MKQAPVPTSHNSGQSVDLRVMSLNLRFGLADDGPNSWAMRCVAYPELLRRQPCDFYAFQEANDFQVSFLNELLSDYDVIGRRRPAPDYWQNNVIFFHKRWRCLNHQHFYLSETPDVPSQFRGSRWPRQCTIGTFIYADRQLTVIDTHFDFEAEVQRQSALLICNRLISLAPAWPVVLMGDLNAGPESSCLAVLTAPGAGFKSALGPGNTGTHHGFKGEADGIPIDWILYLGDVQVRNAQIITDRYCGYFPSDHFPLTADFCWQSPA